LLERLRFLSISASNLDEFYMVRVAGIRGQITNNVASVSKDGLTPAQQLVQINAEVNGLVERQQETWSRLNKELVEAGIVIVEPEELTEEERSLLRDQFMSNVYPLLTPIAVDPAHPFPFIPNKGLTIAAWMEHKVTGKTQNGLVPISSQLSRFVRVRSGRNEGNPIRFIRVEVAIGMFMETLFPGFEMLAQGAFRVLRDSDIELEEEAEDLVLTFEELLRQRRRGNVICLEIDARMPENMRQLVTKELQVGDDEVFVKSGLLGLADTEQLITQERPDLLFAPFNIRYPERVREFDGNVFAAIKAKDFVVHHPYEAFDVVVQFLRQAVNDPNVLAIKWTLYRTSNDSPIVEALKDAVDSGKSVTAVVELKARFDEAANIRWAREDRKS